MFSQVSVRPRGVYTPGRQTPPQQTATAADGTHPTGMHPWYTITFPDIKLSTKEANNQEIVTPDPPLLGVRKP